MAAMAGWPLSAVGTSSSPVATAVSPCPATPHIIGAYPPKLSLAMSATVRRNHLACRDSSPLTSLLNGDWVKLICGASFEDVADVRNLSLIYTLAGVDCIDCAADQSVVCAVREGIESAIHIAQILDQDLRLNRPWVMVSINDDEDLHFRKAEFDATRCPLDCPRPCENICPASAIKFTSFCSESIKGGVLPERCYGCGRCISVCPLGLIGANSYVRSPEVVSELLSNGGIQAIEIHTNARHLESFSRLWGHLHDSVQSLELIAVSLPDLGETMISRMWEFFRVMNLDLKSLNLWQLDGRPMSGDIGAGATMVAVELATRIAAYADRPPGFLQLAGGTNAYTIKALEKYGLDHPICSIEPTSSKGVKTFQDIKDQKIPYASIAGIAYGGHARKIVSGVLASKDLEENAKLECHPHLLLQALNQATSLVGLSKQFGPVPSNQSDWK